MMITTIRKAAQPPASERAFPSATGSKDTHAARNHGASSTALHCAACVSDVNGPSALCGRSGCMVVSEAEDLLGAAEGGDLAVAFLDLDADGLPAKILRRTERRAAAAERIDDGIRWV